MIYFLLSPSGTRPKFKIRTCVEMNTKSSMHSMRGGLCPVVEGPCKRYAMARRVCQATTASRGRRRTQTWLYIYIHTLLCRDIHTWLYICIYTWLYACIHTLVYTYMVSPIMTRIYASNTMHTPTKSCYTHCKYSQGNACKRHESTHA